ncbi:type I-C CRISPR-associated protein Cas7/Csd2 [Roseospira marina]|uniref:Type I-C CRISPR-associated protein Cas7/Csd2 n=1 Tax=Roseospira marina TaxID=140057 RepID=A0A5M6IGP8_9PROT|nr:type I-C CRISPR-associated protein Cas7/Csd2 [Roseospira marina]KAA5606845.1 type I-C CRISPR-associated protein Cas7/Csd2 [Roseospira marina]MBB4312990.1 CRISPR-associated protein Csd2 [Roseospira marina]MBB5086236.1 CRISPR-associated protein Csd2 [Roseospira marina]
MTALAHRHDFVLFFDVVNGNPNGDPDAGNLPRIDQETQHGLVSDVCLKRKVRNFTELARGTDPGFRIYVQDGSILNERHREAYAEVRAGDAKVTSEKKLNPKDDTEAVALQAFMCQQFFDIRTFGAVMGTGINCGQVRGPVQFTFAQSMDPIVPQEITITRMAATTEKEKKERQEGSDETSGDQRTDNRTMGRKHIVPYGLYRMHGFVSAKLAERTGFSDEDLTFLWQALGQMFEHDRSAARGEMTARRLIVFRHDSALGNAQAHSLFDRVTCRRSGDAATPARGFGDYTITVNTDGLPDGITVVRPV